MLGWEITFGQPWYLLLLILAPLLWVLSFKSLAGLGRARRVVALVLRTLVLMGLVFALAEVQLKRISEKLTVMYLLDQSESIPPFKRQLMLDYVSKEVATHRNVKREDRAGVIVFGRDALIEIQAIPDDLPSVGQIESYRQLRTDATNLAAAIKLAQASFLDDSAKRIVIITDGNENVGQPAVGADDEVPRGAFLRKVVAARGPKIDRYLRLGRTGQGHNPGDFARLPRRRSSVPDAAGGSPLMHYHRLELGDRC
jgi:hypothetical protein